MEKRITICQICEHLNIKQFNVIYKQINELNINPLDIKIGEVSLLLFGENKQITKLDNIKLLTKKEYSDTDDYKKKFLNKYISLKNSSEKKEEQKENIYINIIQEILKSLNQVREKEFKVKSNFKLNDSNIKLIEKWLKKDYKLEDFILVHDYVANLYKSNTNNKKLKEGFYFKPSTIYNKKFESRFEEAQNIGTIKEINFDEEILVILKELNDIRTNTFKLSYSYEFNSINKEIIKEKLHKGIKVESILKMFKYIENLYLENDNEKVRSGLYFRPNTIFNENFESRIENSISYFEEIKNDISEEDNIINNLLDE